MVVFSGVFTEVASAQNPPCVVCNQWKIKVQGYSPVLGRIGIKGYFVHSVTGVPIDDTQGSFSADGWYGPFSLPVQPYGFSAIDYTIIDGNGMTIQTGGPFTAGQPFPPPPTAPTGVYTNLPTGTPGWCMDLYIDCTTCPFQVIIDFHTGPC
jgi:hypothetical protein